MTDKIWKVISVMGASHPWTVMRASELIKWVDSGDYERVCRRETVVPVEMPAAFCTGCGAKSDVDDAFCRSCGKKL